MAEQTSGLDPAKVVLTQVPSQTHLQMTSIPTHTVIVFHRLNLGVATVLPVRVIAVDMQQIIQLSPLAALGKLILIHLYYKLLWPTYSCMVYFSDRLNQATKELSATDIGFTFPVIGIINSDLHAAVTNGASHMKFPLGSPSFARNRFYMKQELILLSENQR